MLQAIRERAQGIFAWVMLILVGIPFALWGIQNYLDTGQEQPAAAIGDREIFDREVSRVYEQSLANLVGVDQVDEKQLRHQALEKLIQEEVLAQSAAKKNLTVSDESVAAFIRSLPYFQTEGTFDKEKYKIMLSSQGMSPGYFNSQVRRSLLLDQYQKGILNSAFVTSGQVDTLLKLRNQEREIEYVTIPVKPSTRNFSDAEIESYYREHLSEFKNLEQVSVEYVLISLEDLAKQVHASEEELHNLYEEQKGSFGTEEQRKVSHILVPIESPTEEADKAALAKASEIRGRLGTGEDFAKLAKESSGDPVSAQKGGDLGLIDRKSMDPKFAESAFALKQGDISEPVKTSFGYHLIKVTEIVPAKIKSYEEIREELLKNFQRNTAENKFYELGQRLTELSFEHPDSLEPAATALDLKIEQTGLFTRDAGEGLAAESKFREAAFLEETLNGRNSDPVELGDDKAAVLRIKEHTPASDRPLAEVRDVIVSKLRTEDARRESVKNAEDLFEKARRGQPLAEAAKSRGFTYSKSPAVKRHGNTLPQALSVSAFKAPRPVDGKAELLRTELANGEQVVFRVLTVKEGAPSSTAPSEINTIRDFLGKTAGQLDFSAFVGRLRETADVYVRPQS